MRPERDSCSANGVPWSLLRPRVYRKKIVYNHVHTCIYFLQPNGHSLKQRVVMGVARLRPFLFDPFLAQRPQEATPFSFFIAPTLTNCSLYLEATLTIGSGFGVLDSTSLVALLLIYLLFASPSVSPTVYAEMH